MGLGERDPKVQVAEELKDTVYGNKSSNISPSTEGVRLGVGETQLANLHVLRKGREKIHDQTNIRNLISNYFKNNCGETL